MGNHVPVLLLPGDLRLSETGKPQGRLPLFCLFPGRRHADRRRLRNHLQPDRQFRAGCHRPLRGFEIVGVRSRLHRLRFQSRRVPLSCLAAPRPPSGPLPHFRGHVRGNDQDRYLRHLTHGQHPRSLYADRWHYRARFRNPFGCPWRYLRSGPARHQTSFGLPQR